jgi:RHS repeat-associated protein
LTPDPGVVGVTASGLFYLPSTNTFMVGQSNFKGRKNYELTNHLGNVMAVVSDRLTKYSVVEAGVIPYSLPNMVSATDYDPFGMALEQREWQPSGVEEYSFSFNSKIEDAEILDCGRWQDYGFRAYRPDLGRFVSVDPLAGSYPELTTYQFASNTPVMAVDLDGLEMFYAANGTFIASIGNDQSVRRVDGEENAKAVMGAILIFKVCDAGAINPDMGELQQAFRNVANDNLNIVMQKSVDIGISNDELNARAFLNTVSVLEGAAYGVRVGSEKYTGNKHPGMKKIWLRGKWTPASAAGAYQITLETATRKQKALGLGDDFSPIAQDKIAIALIKDKGALDDVKQGCVREAFGKLKGVWSSLPGGVEPSKGKSPYLVFKESRARELMNETRLATPKGALNVE